MTFAEYWKEHEPFGCNPDEVAELAWNAATEAATRAALTLLVENEAMGKSLQHVTARLEKCEAAIDVVLTGGNHLASVLINRLGDKSFPPYGTPVDKVQAQLSVEDSDIWIAWRAIMLLRDAARAALEE